VGRDGVVDGNKRTALAAALVFLLLNEVEIHSSEHDLTELGLGDPSGAHLGSM
jgi:prophage maintenance system killer protein